MAVIVIRSAPGAPPRSWREAAALDRRAAKLPSWQLTQRQRADLELLSTARFAPLRGFLGQDDYARVCQSMRLADGTLWPIPVTLDLPEEVAVSSCPGGAWHCGTTMAPCLAYCMSPSPGGRTLPPKPKRYSGPPTRPMPGPAPAPAGSSPGTSPVSSTWCGRRSAPPSADPPHARGTAGRVHTPWLVADRRVPDPQPHASGAPGTNPASITAVGRACPDPSRCRNDQAR